MESITFTPEANAQDQTHRLRIQYRGTIYEGVINASVINSQCDGVEIEDLEKVMLEGYHQNTTKIEDNLGICGVSTLFEENLFDKCLKITMNYELKVGKLKRKKETIALTLAKISTTAIKSEPTDDIQLAPEITEQDKYCLHDQIEDLKRYVESLQSQITGLKLDNDSLQAQTKDLKLDNESLHSKIQDMTQNSNSLQSLIKNLKQDYDSFKEQITNLKIPDRINDCERKLSHTKRIKYGSNGDENKILFIDRDKKVIFICKKVFIGYGHKFYKEQFENFGCKIKKEEIIWQVHSQRNDKFLDFACAYMKTPNAKAVKSNPVEAIRLVEEWFNNNNIFEIVLNYIVNSHTVLNLQVSELTSIAKISFCIKETRKALYFHEPEKLRYRVIPDSPLIQSKIINKLRLPGTQSTWERFCFVDTE